MLTHFCLFVSGQTPLDLAEDDEMDEFLLGHLYDLNYFGSDKKRWRFAGPWQSTCKMIWLL